MQASGPTTELAGPDQQSCKERIAQCTEARDRESEAEARERDYS